MKVPFRSRRGADKSTDDGDDFDTAASIDGLGSGDDADRSETDRAYLETYGVVPSVPDVVPVSPDQIEAAPLDEMDGKILDTGEVAAARPAPTPSAPPPIARRREPVDPGQSGGPARPEPRRQPDDFDGDVGGDSDADFDSDFDVDVDDHDDLEGPVAAEDFSSRMEKIHSESGSEQRSAWAYLGLLSGMFVCLVGFGWACSDQRSTDVAGGDPVELMTGAEPASLVFRVDGDVVAVQGSVPDEAARDQLLAAAQATYGPENVVDDLEVDDGTTLEAGTVRFVGTSVIGDDRPETLQSVVDSTFGLANRGFEVGKVETVLSPVSAEVAIVDSSVTLSGVVPDEESAADLVAVAGEVWGPGNVDSTGLTVGDTTWTDGLIRLTGSTAASDVRVGDFDRLVSERIDTLVNVDTSALTLVDDSVLREEVQATVDELVEASPIQFAPNSPVIDSASDDLLTEVAAALNEAPDVKFEVVGHTDNVGNDQENLVLSQERAAAVVERLTELGVEAERMSSRGEGEDNPIADNATTEGKAANRRIEFILFGTSEAEEPSEESSDE